MDNQALIEELSAEIHKCYCLYYLKRFGKDYHTFGDYSKLDEQTKDADREMARWVIADRARTIDKIMNLYVSDEWKGLETLRKLKDNPS